MRSYSVAIASLVIDATSKWTDNLLTQHAIPGISSARRGIARRISHSALIRIALIRQLHIHLGVSVGNGVRIATRLLDSSTHPVFRSGHLSLSVDLMVLAQQVDDSLASVLESAPTPRRGRPPGKRRT